ncbi:MAG: hypothetical protein ACYTBX_08030 [Planctomycetota bacterium]|jgi:hypothetical protein
MKAISLRKMVIAIVIIGIGAGYVWADKQQFQEKLSREVKIQLTDVTIAEALEKIGQEAEVKIVLSDEAVWKLPQGEATRLSVTLQGPLADSMTEMLNAFFMRYAVGDEKITIYPRPELEHIIGRPNAKQLELLKRIYSMNMTFGGKVSPESFMQVVKGGFEKLSFVPYFIPLDICKVLDTTETGKGSLPVTLAVLLEQVGNIQHMPRWYLSGMDFPDQVDQVPVIKVVHEQDFREAILDQVVDISFKEERAEVIIQRLANWTGMELVVQKTDPSWLSEKISVNMQNVKLGQALRNVVSTVDGYIVIDHSRNQIPIRGPMHVRKPAVPKAIKSGNYVGKISIPMDGGKYYIEFMLRESDLTDELKKLRAEKIKKILGEPPKPKPEAAKPARSKKAANL